MKKQTIEKTKTTLIDALSCPVTKSMQVIGGKWKPVIIYAINNNIQRFGILQKTLTGISKQMLTKELRELEKYGIINRVVYPVVPPHVEYSLTDRGYQVLPIIKELSKFGKNL